MGLGASAGLTLTPLPWKLLDDISIWTQNWPWVPVPKAGVVSIHDSICTLCPGGCGITARRIDERLVFVAGQENHPLNAGGICPLGLSGPQLLYTPNRVMSPMMKVDGAFQPISWNAAISTLVSHLKELKQQQLPQGLACLAGSGQGTVSALLQRFLTAFGSPNFIPSASIDDAWELLTGQLTGSRFIPGYDLERADTILSFGCDLTEGWGSPIRTMRACSGWKENGAKLVQIQSRLSDTAATADRWIAINPGTEADLALAICRTVAETARGQSHISAIDSGFRHQLQAIIKPGPSLEQAEGITGVDAQVIQQLADDFVGSKRPLALCREGADRSPVASREMLAVLALNAVAGNIDRPGGLHRIKRVPYINWPEIRRDDVAGSGWPGENLAGPLPSPDAFFKTIAEEPDSPVGILLVSDCNPCYDLAASDRIKRGIGKIPLVVSFSEYWNETALAANLILPNHSYLERYQDFPVYAGLTEPRLGLSRPVSKQLFDTRYTGDAILETARQLWGTAGRAFPWKTYEECLKETLSDQWDDLKGRGWINLPRPPITSDNAATISYSVFSNADIETSAGEVHKYPLMILTRSSMRLNNSAVGTSPFMMKSVSDTVLKGKKGVVDVNPQTAEKLNMTEGDMARLITPEAEAAVMIHLDDGTMPDTVVISQGLGHAAFGEYLDGRGVNASRLLQPVLDPLTGQNISRTVRARLMPV